MKSPTISKQRLTSDSENTTTTVKNKKRRDKGKRSKTKIVKPEPDDLEEEEKRSDAEYSDGEEQTAEKDQSGDFFQRTDQDQAARLPHDISEDRRKSSSDFGTFHNFVNFSDLTKLSRIEPNVKGQFHSTYFKYERPIYNFKIRVKLLKYPSLSQQQKNWTGDLLVVDDRVFSWQEKVFSKTEAEFYVDKKNLVTELDQKYNKEITQNPNSVGVHLYSLVDSELKIFLDKEILKSTVKQCAASHSARTTRGLSSASGSLTGASSTNLKPINSEGESIDEEEPQSSDDDKGTTLKNFQKKSKKLSFNINKMTSDRKWLVKQKLRKEQMIEGDKKAKEKAAKKKLKKGGESVDEDSEGGEAGRSVNLSEGQESQDDGGKSSRKSRKSKSFVISNVPQLYGKRGMKSSKAKKHLGFLSEEYSMKILARIPHMPRTKRDLTVSTIKNVPAFGVVVMKPAFGFRIIEAKRNHVYRLSWELYRQPGLEDTLDLKEIEEDSSRKKKLLTSAGMSGISPFSPIDNGLKENIFDMVGSNELKLVIMGEILSAEKFDEDPLSVHYYIELPKGWKNESGSTSHLHGATHNCVMNENDTSHFSHEFTFSLTFSMDSLLSRNEGTYTSPVILIMVISSRDPNRIRHEGYSYIHIPSQPGTHLLTCKTWKPKARTIQDKFADIFLDASPSIQNIQAAHIPTASLDKGECKRANRLNLTTVPSGDVRVRLNVIHQTSSSISNQRNTLQLLEKMSSATIMKSVEVVINAFQNARIRANNASKGMENHDI